MPKGIDGIFPPGHAPVNQAVNDSARLPTEYPDVVHGKTAQAAEPDLGLDRIASSLFENRGRSLPPVPEASYNAGLFLIVFGHPTFAERQQSAALFIKTIRSFACCNSSPLSFSGPSS